ncbi:MAG: YiiX/YebB-like N1pC/P60 family cysteine hydrolase [Akkermansiaceae bacterium]
MKLIFREKFITLLVVFLVALTSTATIVWAKQSKLATAKQYDIQEGDIVFQESDGGQGKAIKAATNSRWTHVGIVYFKDGKPMVLEAVQPVQVVPLKTFIARSPKSFYAMRVKNLADKTTRSKLARARLYAEQQVGKNYDFRFQWSDSRIYCSELVWKIYNTAGVKLCEPRKFSSYNLKHPTVQRIIKQRYGSMQNLPLNELAVAPSDLAQSALLEEVPRKK